MQKLVWLGALVEKRVSVQLSQQFNTPKRANKQSRIRTQPMHTWIVFTGLRCDVFEPQNNKTQHNTT